jgi:glutamate-5-semialdehyde dehydrogenase
MTHLEPLTHAARAAYTVLAASSHADRLQALRAMAASLRAASAEILEANAKDIASTQGLSAAMHDRLLLTPARVEAMAQAMETLTHLPDPLAADLGHWKRPNGLKITRVPVPLGVIGVIYESRPNVTADAAALCVLSGNAVILRGGSESIASSRAIVQAIQSGLELSGLPIEAVQMIAGTDRAWVGAMLSAVGQIDVLIPRGGKSLTARVQAESRVPTLLHLDGNCHSYIHTAADLTKAQTILHNAKLRRTGVCGATESLLIDRALLPQLKMLLEPFFAAGCELRGDGEAQGADKRILPATEEDWRTEYLDAVLSVKVVADVQEAIAHINLYGSHHTDAILTEDENVAAQFLQGVDSAIVMHNASTQFADGGEFGFGGEIGIATGRLHARGPVGAAQLTTYKYVVQGQGQVRP